MFSRSPSLPVLNAGAWTYLVVAMAAALLTSTVRDARAQDATPRATLLELAADLSARLDARLTPLYHRLLESTDSLQISLNTNRDIQLAYIDARGMPAYLTIDNIQAARTISTDDVWPAGSAGFSLTGSQTAAGELAVWDAGAARTTHQELTPRATWADAATYVTHWHATHVAGTMIGAGVNANAHGMSYQAPIDSYNWTNDASEMATAAANGLRVSNHSYGLISGWYWDSAQSTWYWFGDLTLSTNEDWKFGFYTAECRAWDQIAVAAPTYTIVKSSGNDHLEGPAAGTWHQHWDSSSAQWVSSNDVHALDGAGGFDCIPAKGNAKNIITVGAVGDISNGYSQTSDVVITSFSSRGPTDDGRIKPDIVANGDNLYSCYDQSDNAYTWLSGTSMATPNASGSINLIVDYYEATHGGQSPRSATVKAIVIDTADEAGASWGPDYTYGWGLMNTRKAVELVERDSLYAATPNGHLIEATLQNTAVDTFYVWKTQWEEVRITLAWTDPAASVPGYTVDPTTSMLVNDLDLRCERVSDGWSVDPWFLDPQNPAAAAQHGDNSRDNVERLELANGSLQAYYRVTVSHKGTLTGGSQDYSLVADRPLRRCISWQDVTIGTVADNGYAAYTTAWGDYDDDGDPDLFLGRSDKGNLLYRNEGAGTFVDVAGGAIADSVAAEGVAWGDYDNDGDLDLFVVSNPNRLLRNEGSDVFVDVSTSVIESTDSKSVTWGDYDGDGYLDLYVGALGSVSKLLHNEGNGTFADSTAYPLTQSFAHGSGWADTDDDGDLDLYISRITWGNVLLRNDGAAGFAEISPGNPINYMGDVRNSVWGDYDNDEDLDVYVVNSNEANVLFRNDGNGSFADVTAGVLGDASWSTTASWGDMDNDGDLDLVLGTPDGDVILRNDGANGFADATEGALIRTGTGPHAALADWDGDGDLDLQQGIIWGTSEVKLLENGLCNGNDYLDVRLSGPSSNLGGVGSRVRIVAGGQAQIREISSGGGYLAQCDLVAHFGLGALDSGGTARGNGLVDTLQVYWSSGAVQETTMVAANQTIEMIDPTPPAVVHVRTHDIGDLHVSMTDQGSIGFLDETQPGDGRGLVYPDGSTNHLFIGSLWVSDGNGYVAARDYSSDPELELVPDASGGQVIAVTDSTAEQTFHSSYSDADGQGIFHVDQTSWARSDAADDDYVIVRYIVRNDTGAELRNVRAGLFLDLDLGSAYDDSAGTDLARHLAYMTDASGPCVGVALLEGGDSPYYASNVTIIDNPIYVWPDRYIHDADREAFLAASDSAHAVTASNEANDWSVLVSAGPFTLAAGDSAGAVFVIAGGSSLVDLRAAVDRAQDVYAPLPVAVGDPTPPRRPYALLPMAPNPFTASTAVRYELPDASDVRVLVFDVRGRRVAALVDGRQDAGVHAVSWTGRDAAGRAVGSGVYFVRLESGLGVRSRRVTVLR